MTQARARRSLSFNSKMRLLVLAGAFLAGLVLWSADRYFTQSFTEDARTQTRFTATQQAGDVISVLEKQSAVPLILARDDVLIKTLIDRDFSQTSQRLISIQSELGAAQNELTFISFGQIINNGQAKAGTWRGFI